MSLAGRLAALEASGLTRLVTLQPEMEYVFRHALVQDAAYASLVKQDRRQLHRAVGEALERLHPERRDELAPLLARHFHEAGDTSRALKYFTLAGDAAARVYANAEAVLHYASAIDVARRILTSNPLANSADGLGAAELTHLYLSRGQALELSARHPDALANYAELEALARERDDRPMELAALMARAKIYATLNAAQNPARARAVLEQSLALARELDDRAAECRVLWNLMLLLLWGGGDQRQSVAYGEEALALARALNMREQVAFTLNDLAYGYMSTGRWAAAQGALDESRAIWRELGNLPMLVDNLSNSVLLYLRAGEHEQAVSTAEQAQAIAGAIGNVWGQAGSRAYVSHVYLERGEPDRAMAIMEEGIRLGEQVGHPALIVASRADLAWTFGTLGAIRRGLELVDLALSRAARVEYLRVYPMAVQARLYLLDRDLAAAEAALRAGYRELQPDGLQWFAPIWLPLTEAELAYARHDFAHTISIADGLLANLRESGARLFVADALYLKGRALLAMDRWEQAFDVLGEARAQAEALGSRRALWPILVALSEMAAHRHDLVTARLLQGQARALIGYIADHAGAPELRAAFLQMPLVRIALREV